MGRDGTALPFLEREGTIASESFQPLAPNKQRGTRKGGPPP